jgi:hypothetical protein
MPMGLLPKENYLNAETTPIFDMGVNSSLELLTNELHLGR